MPSEMKLYIKKAKAQDSAKTARIEALVDAAIGLCEPENADEKATEYTRQTLRRKFREILEQ